MKLMDSALGTETLAQLLVRDNALVFAMEHVRIIIMHDKVRRPGRVPLRLYARVRMHVWQRRGLGAWSQNNVRQLGGICL